jgi:glycosyltransferase involved in cell wall biosynthesis/ActR/RegA family two-component response regulator
MMEKTESPQQMSIKKRILIVDDDIDSCNLLRAIFTTKGFETLASQDGTSAIKTIHQTAPDVIILDVMLPNMDGWEIYRKIRDFCDTPVVFLSALGSEENAIRALEIGAYDYIRKPFSNREIVTRIEALFDRLAPRIPEKNWVFVPNWGLSNQISVSVVIPTLNEAKNLDQVLPRLPMQLIDEVILVDGFSTDGTVEIAKKLLPSIKVVYQHVRGKGAALRAGYKASSGQIIVVLDADGSHDPREIPRFIANLIEGSDIVKGSRFSHGGGTTDMPRYRRIGNDFFTLLVNLLFNGTITDLCYGYHAFWRYCLDVIDLENFNGFEIDAAIYVRAIKARLRLTEVPSFEGYRFHGIGKLKTIPDGFRVLKTILNEYIGSFVQGNPDNYPGFRSMEDFDKRIITSIDAKGENIQ